MTTINGIVTIGDTEVPGQADVLLLNAAGTDVVASTKSDAVTGAYAFEGLPGGTVFRVLVLGGGVYRSRAFGPVVTEADTGGDPYWENVVSLLRFDELAGDAVLDEKGFSWNFAGAVRLDTAVKRFGAASYGRRPPNASNYAYMAQAQPNAFTISGDFTAEIFARLDAGRRHTLFSTNIVNPNEGFYCAVMSDGSIRTVFGTSTGYLTLDTAVAVPFDTWNHVAVSKRGTAISVFLNGKRLGRWDVTHVFVANSQAIVIGSEANQTVDRMAVGWLDEFRFTRNVARYTEDFTPPTEPFPNF